jgi:polyisoprenyl-phosphate glycosyltransferase
MRDADTLITIITPAFNEEQNLPKLHAKLKALSDAFGGAFEWIIVDDHSRDKTFEVASELAASDKRLRVFRLARNAGSHNAVFCGLKQCRGACAVLLAADLQDPPEIIPAMLNAWRGGTQVVWGVRASAPQTSWTSRAFARLYYHVMRRWAGLENLAPTGADMVLLDRTTIDALLGFGERNLSIFALISWIGFRQSAIPYKKANRLHGRSGWTLSKKLKLAIDSVTAFSFFPVRLFSGLGILFALLGFAYAALIIGRFLIWSSPVEGWSSLMVAVLLIGGLQLLMLGVLGEYLWRTLDEARARPRYLLEASVGGEDERNDTEIRTNGHTRPLANGGDDRPLRVEDFS